MPSRREEGGANWRVTTAQDRFRLEPGDAPGGRVIGRVIVAVLARHQRQCWKGSGGVGILPGIVSAGGVL